MGLGKRKQRLQTRLGELRAAHSGCFVCGNHHGINAGREGTKLRCTRCEEAGATTDFVLEYEDIRAELARLNGSNRRGSGKHPDRVSPT